MWSITNRKLSFSLLPAVLFGLGISAPAISVDLDGYEDFAPIFKGGGRMTVQGGYPALPTTPGYPATLGPLERNSYSWSMEWHDDGSGDALYVGTVRDILCAAGVVIDLSTPCPDFSTLPPGFDDKQRAEIWKYTPSLPTDKGGANGSWARIMQSPLGGFDPFLMTLVEAISGVDFSVIPRDIGYRTQAVCDTIGSPGTTDELFATTSGIPGNILYHDSSAAGTPGDPYFKETSRTGLNAGLFNFLPTEFGGSFDGDIGYRGLACFNGVLITSPASSVNSGSEDVSENPILLGNTSPAQGGDWAEVVNFRTHATLGDANNFGAFDMIVFGGYLWIAVSNRTDGAELWRGDGSNFGTSCTTDCGGTVPGSIAWTKVFDSGAGRPFDDIGLGPLADNALGTFGTLDGKLYVGLWESGFFDASLAELVVVDPGTGPGDESWELAVGQARPNYTDQNGAGQVFEKMTCDATLQEYTASGILDPNGAPECYPSSGRDRGFGAVVPKGTPQCSQPFPDFFLGCGGSGGTDTLGEASYFWRFADHDNELYMGTFNFDSLSSSGPNTDGGGFEFYKTTPGDMGRIWTTIDLEGFKNPLNYGVRSLKSTPLGLFLGTANPFTNAPVLAGFEEFYGGTEVYLGTLAASLAAPPIADAGRDIFVFDEENYPEPGDGSETVTLDGSDSADPHGGSVTSYEWFNTTGVTVACGDLPGAAVFISSSVSPEVTPAAGNPTSTGIHEYTLRVTDNDGNKTCASTMVTVSENLEPLATFVSTDPPFTLFPFGSSILKVMTLVDFDGDDEESFEVNGSCVDPEDTIASCSFIGESGISISDSNALNGPATITAKTDDYLVGMGMNPNPTLTIYGVDDFGFDDSDSMFMAVQSFTDTPSENDAPVCGNGHFTVEANSSIQINPVDIANRLCGDPDDDDTLLTYEIDSAPSKGTAVPTVGPNGILYTPDPGESGTDTFRFSAVDPGSEESFTATIKITIEGLPLPLPAILDLLLD